MTEQNELARKITSLRMERQHFFKKANEQEYIELFRDTSPGYQVYWIGFGQPPVLTYRTEFDDAEFNRTRMKDRRIVLGRFIGGNLGWIEPSDWGVFGSLYKKALPENKACARYILDVLKTTGPLGVQQIKEETGMLVKDITAALKQLQEAFLVFEDRYDNEWDRCFYPFEEMFPNVNTDLPRTDALKVFLKRFAYRNITIDGKQIKSFYKLPNCEINTALAQLAKSGETVLTPFGYMLASDVEILKTYECKPLHFVYAINRKDFLYRSYEHIIKQKFEPLYADLPYDSEPFHYLLIDGEFHGVSVGHVHNGPFDINDIVTDLPRETAERYRDEIIKAVTEINLGQPPIRFMNEKIL